MSLPFVRIGRDPVRGRATRPEADHVHSPFQRGVVVLDAGRLAEHARLDVPHEVHAIDAGEIPRADAFERAHQGHRQGRRPAQARAEGNAGPELDLQGLANLEGFEERSDERRPRVREELGRAPRPLLDGSVPGKDPQSRFGAPDPATRESVDRQVDRRRARVQDMQRPQVQSPARQIDPSRRRRFDDAVGLHAIRILRSEGLRSMARSRRSRSPDRKAPGTLDLGLFRPWTARRQPRSIPDAAGAEEPRARESDALDGDRLSDRRLRDRRVAEHQLPDFAVVGAETGLVMGLGKRAETRLVPGLAVEADQRAGRQDPAGSGIGRTSPRPRRERTKRARRRRARSRGQPRNAPRDRRRRPGG